MRLSFDGYLAHIRAESARFADVLADADPAARVPACPDWSATDLLTHLAGVQDFWTHVITHRPAPPATYEEPTFEGDHTALVAGFRSTSATFTERLGAADPADPAWSWAPEQTVGFTYRRQALEALIHRVDAEQAAGLPSELDPALAADCVDEVLDVMYGGKPSWGEFAPLPHYVRVDLTDVDQRIWVQLGSFAGTDPESGEQIQEETDIAVVPPPGAEPDAAVSGPASALALWLWQRSDRSQAIEVHGDLQIFDRFRLVTQGPIN